jgi:bacillithiol synthase
VAGPGELAYFAQVTAVAAALEVPPPLAVPRWSGLIIPADVDALLQSRGWTPETLQDPHAAETSVARAALPTPAADGLRALRGSIDREVGRLDGVLPPAAIAGAKGDLARRLDRLERRTLAIIKRREADMLMRVGRARGIVHPDGVAQERALNIVPLWARHGEPLLAALRAATATHAARWWPSEP